MTWDDRLDQHIATRLRDLADEGQRHGVTESMRFEAEVYRLAREALDSIDAHVAKE